MFLGIVFIILFILLLFVTYYWGYVGGFKERENLIKSENIFFSYNEMEKEVKKKLYNKVQYYYYAAYEGYIEEYNLVGDIYLRSDLKRVGAYYNGEYHFCGFKGSCSNEVSLISGRLNPLFSDFFNRDCREILKKMMVVGLEKTKEEITLLADYYENRYNICVSDRYVGLKMREAEYRYRDACLKLKQKEEEQAQKEYQRAIKKAEKDIHKAQAKLEEEYKNLQMSVSEHDRIILKRRIKKLEETLMIIQEKQQRAISMAEQTRAGYVYVISNVSSFGKGVYKIGMTRRLDPMERIMELSNASVPFPFDVHSFIYSEDAPDLESKLHLYFSRKRVNESNIRKEFFRVELEDIKKALRDLGVEADFIPN